MQEVQPFFAEALKEKFSNLTVITYSADNIFILADSSKFEKKAILKLDDMKNEYIYVTDSSLHDELKKLYKENNIKICSEGSTKWKV